MWTYDKFGNIREIATPINDKLEPVKPANTTMYGQIPSSVGCATNKWNFNPTTGQVARGIDLRKH